MHPPPPTPDQIRESWWFNTSFFTPSSQADAVQSLWTSHIKHCISLYRLCLFRFPAGLAYPVYSSGFLYFRPSLQEHPQRISVLKVSLLTISFWGSAMLIIPSLKTVSIFPLKKKLFSLVTILAALGLRCCVQVFSSCGDQKLLSSCHTWASHCGGLSSSRARAPGWSQQLQLIGSRAQTR